MAKWFEEGPARGPARGRGRPPHDYDSQTRRLYSLDAGWNSYLAEAMPMTIPANDMGPLSAVQPTQGPEGRKTPVYRPRGFARNSDQIWSGLCYGENHDGAQHLAGQGRAFRAYRRGAER